MHLYGEIVIKEATLEDVKSVEHIIARAYLNHFKAIYIAGYAHMAWGQNPDYFINQRIEQNNKVAQEFIKKQGDQPSFRVVIAHEESQTAHEPLGICVFYKKDAQTTHIRFLFVEESARKKGIGKKLQQYAQTCFSDATTCTLNTLAYANDETQKFYEHLGYKKTGYVTIDPQYPDTHFGYQLEL